MWSSGRSLLKRRWQWVRYRPGNSLVDGGRGKPQDAAQEKGAQKKHSGHPERGVEQQLGRAGPAACKRSIRAGHVGVVVVRDKWDLVCVGNTRHLPQSSEDEGRAGQRTEQGH